MPTLPENVKLCNLTEILARHAKAALGPMTINRYDNSDGSINWQIQQDGHEGEVISNVVDSEVPRAKATAQFIVAAWVDVPAMANELEALRAAALELYNADIAIDERAIRKAMDRILALLPS